MSYDQYWHGDPDLVIMYEKANEIQYNRKELDLWKLGVYIQRAYASIWDKDEEYPSEPLFKIKTKEEIEFEEKKKMQSMRMFWEMVAVQQNAKFNQGSK